MLNVNQVIQWIILTFIFIFQCNVILGRELAFKYTLHHQYQLIISYILIVYVSPSDVVF